LEVGPSNPMMTRCFAVVNEVRDEYFWGISRVKKCHAAGTGRRLEVEGQRVIVGT
jgi:hypothetical protein